MGHIELATPVSHVWFFKGLPSRIGHLLDITLRDLERVLYFEATSSSIPVTSGLEGEPAPDEELPSARQARGAARFDARMGAEAIKELLRTRSTIEDLASRAPRGMRRGDETRPSA